MKFCMQCGAEISEGVNFCRSCGAKVNSAETHDKVKAPDTEGNAKAPDTESNVKAPDTEGEFVLASWNAPAPRRDTAERHEEGPKKEEVPQAKEKKQGCLSYILLFGKVLFIAVGSVFLLVFLMELFSDDKPETPKTEQHQPVKPGPDTDTDDATIIPNGDESVFPKAEELGSSDNVETVEDRIIFLEGLLQRSEDQLEEELAKGDEADMKSVTEIRDGIARIREELKELKKNK